jgi:hypothetical protein
MSTRTAPDRAPQAQSTSTSNCVSPPSEISATDACVVDVKPSLDSGAIGTQRSITLRCDSAAALLPGPSATPYPTTGCFDVQASIADITSGISATFVSAICGNMPVSPRSPASCSDALNPLCAVGYASTGSSGCSPCPAGLTLVGSNCQGPPVAGTCPPGSTPITNAGGGIINCVSPPFPSTPSPANDFQVTFDLGAPDVFLVTFKGFVGTTPSGACPESTIRKENVLLNRPSNPANQVFGTACQFTLQVQARNLEVNHIQVDNGSPCGGILPSNGSVPVIAQGCIVKVTVTGLVVLKLGVNCKDGSEPSTGSSAEGAGFPPGSVYQCVDGALSVTGIVVPNAPVQLQVINGVFNPTCLPASVSGGAASATPTPTSAGLQATTTPTVPPTPSPPSPTPTGTLTPVSTLPKRAPSSGLAACSLPGPTTIRLVTGANGQVNFFGNEAEYSAHAVPYNPPLGTNVDIVGSFAIDGGGVGGVIVYTQIRYENGSVQFCGPVVTGGSGLAHCVQNVGNPPSGALALADVDFILNCRDFFTETSFVPGGSKPAPPTPDPINTAPSPNGLCILRTGMGALQIEVSYPSIVDSQPPVDTGAVTVGVFSNATPVPPTGVVVPFTATPTSTPTPTNTPVPTPTPLQAPGPPPSATLTPTPIPTSTPRPTVTPTATSTSAPARSLNFSLDGARVNRAAGNGCAKSDVDGVDAGTRICMMMTYTVRSMPGDLARLTKYELRFGSRTAFAAEYSGTQKVSELGGFVRYIAYTLPSGLNPGVYDFKATLKIDNVTKERDWRFAVLRSAALAAVLFDTAG